jgi:hypothetical protein
VGERDANIFEPFLEQIFNFILNLKDLLMKFALSSILLYYPQNLLKNRAKFLDLCNNSFSVQSPLNFILFRRLRFINLPIVSHDFNARFLPMKMESSNFLFPVWLAYQQQLFFVTISDSQPQKAFKYFQKLVHFFLRKTPN